METASERAGHNHPETEGGGLSVAPVSEQVVSALAQPMSDSTFRSEYVREHLLPAAIRTASQTERNTISEACVHNNPDGYGRANRTFSSLGTDVGIGLEIHATFVVGRQTSLGERLSPLSISC